MWDLKIGSSARDSTRGADLDSFLSIELSRLRSRYRITYGVPSRRSKHRIAIGLLMLILIGFLFLYSGSHIIPILLASSTCAGTRPNTPNSASRNTIALIDQLDVDHPDTSFIANVSSSAKDAGYALDYLSRNASLNFFANLPNQGYSIIILRTHGTGLQASDQAGIITSDPYSKGRYVIDQLTGNVVAARVNGGLYFALGPRFVSEEMCGHFSNTLVLSMFCGSSQVSSLAKAFLEKGAGAYIGWDGTVSLVHTELVFKSLVKLLLNGDKIDSAIHSTMRTLGRDPIWQSSLVSYSQDSFMPDQTALWQEYWYIISAGLVAVILGLQRVESRHARRNAQSEKVKPKR